jgi:hypothetical protein
LTLRSSSLVDLLHLDGEGLASRPLQERKEGLRTVLSDKSSPLQFSDHQIGRGQTLYEHAHALKLKGIVSKRADARLTRHRQDTTAPADFPELAAVCEGVPNFSLHPGPRPVFPVQGKR